MYRELWGTEKRSQLMQSLEVTDFASAYERTLPEGRNRYSFRPWRAAADYLAWPRLLDLCSAEPISGLAEKRRGALMADSRDELAERMQAYFDDKVTMGDLLDLGASGLTEMTTSFKPEAVRSRVRDGERFSAERIYRYALYPLDNRWAFWSAVPGLWNRARPDLMAHHRPGNSFIVTRMVAERPNENVPVAHTRHLPDHHLLRPNVVAIPVWLHREMPAPGGGATVQRTLFDNDGERAIANLSRGTRTYLSELGTSADEHDGAAADLVWMHALAIGHSPAYLAENGIAVRADWPRVPLPATAEALSQSATLGRRIAALLDSDTPVDGVTAGSIDSSLQTIAVISRVAGGALDPAMGDLKVTAGWGNRGQEDVVMPGSGDSRLRDYEAQERTALEGAAATSGGVPAEALRLLGEKTYDIYLNGLAYWRNVPAAVWTYRIGGYQVLKKWLSYREESVLGRSLTVEEVRYFRDMARRIAAILCLEPALDANYHVARSRTYTWPSATASAGRFESA